MALTRRQGRSARSRGAVAHPGTVTFEEKFRRAVRGRPPCEIARCHAAGPAVAHSGGRGGRRRPWRRSPAPRIAPRHPRLRARAQSAPPSSAPCAATGSRTHARTAAARARTYTCLHVVTVTFRIFARRCVTWLRQRRHPKPHPRGVGAVHHVKEHRRRALAGCSGAQVAAASTRPVDPPQVSTSHSSTPVWPHLPRVRNTACRASRSVGPTSRS
jgi:hypothetical protein